MFPRLVTFIATGRSTAHTKCRNEVKDLKRSVRLCGRAVADNVNEAETGPCDLGFGERETRRCGEEEYLARRFAFLGARA